MSRSQIDPKLLKILEQYHDDPKSAVWNCHGTIVAYHKAIEQIAARAGITFDPPVIVEMNTEKRIAVVCVTGHMGDRTIWSFGEASPHNNKNGYPVSMAEKRAVDRVVLKLIGLHGEIYSEDEADDFKPQKQAAPVNDVPDESLTSDEMVAEIDAIKENSKLFSWGRKWAAAIANLPQDEQAMVRAAYLERRKVLTHEEAA